MRIFLAFALLLNSFVAVGGVSDQYDSSEIEALILKEPEPVTTAPMNCAEQFKNRRGPAAAPECHTASQLMSANVGGADFTRICRRIVQEDQGCQKLAPEKRMSCNAKRENELMSTADLLTRAGQCIKGFAWDSMVDLGKFIIDLVKMLVSAQINSYTAMYKFLTDSEYRENALRAASNAGNSVSRLGMAFLRSSAQYFAREFPRNLQKHPFNPMLALGETLFKPLIEMMTNAVQQIAAYYIPQFQCMNGTAKLYTICRTLGDFIMPPAFMFSFLKYGVRGLATMARTAGPTIARVLNRFKEANEVRVAARASEGGARVASDARAAREARITVDRTAHPPRRTPRTEPAPRPSQRVTPTAAAHPPRPRPAAPLAKPIEEHSADDLIEVARSERAESAAVADANRAELARIQAQDGAPAIVAGLEDTSEYKAVLDGLTGAEKTEAANAIEALSKSGASPGIVVGLFQKYAPHFRAEVARTPAGAENLWSKLGRFVKREKAAGKTDQAIEREIDDAFKCN